MRFLRDKDYNRQIKADNLGQINESDEFITIELEQTAQAEITSYLTQRYDMSRLFTDTTSFSTTSTYYANNRVEYSEPSFDQQAIYATGSRISYNDKIYIAKAGPLSGISPDFTTDWLFLVDNQTLYYGLLPVPEWDIDKEYLIGDQIWYENKVYTAIFPRIHAREVDYSTYQAYDGIGAFGPVYPTNTQYWASNGTYSFTNELPENTTYWIRGDNRNQQIVMYMIDIVLYHMHSRINPRNVPQLRMVRYDGMGPHQGGGAIGWLKGVASGKTNLDAKEIIPEQGLGISWGSESRNENQY